MASSRCEACDERMREGYSCGTAVITWRAKTANRTASSAMLRVCTECQKKVRRMQLGVAVARKCAHAMRCRNVPCDHALRCIDCSDINGTIFCSECFVTLILADA
jgi:hypothetical protein